MDLATVLADHFLWQTVSLTPDGPGIRTSLTPAETVVLQQLAQGADVLEIGAAYGYSTVAMGLVARSLVSVDPHTGLANSAEQQAANLVSYGLTHRVRVLLATSQAACPHLGRFDLIFVDGDHSYDGTRYDLTCARRLLRPGGRIVVHDYERLYEVRQAVGDSGCRVLGVVDSLVVLSR